MADSKISDFAEDTTPSADDLIVTVNDPAGTPANKKVTVANLDTFLSATTKTLTNKTLTSPKINENVAITATATELNYTDGVTSAIQTQLDGKQASDADLTTIAGLTATTDNFMVATASAWASRTPTQARTQLGLGALATLATVGTSQIDNDAVTYAKIQNVSATDKVLGRTTAGAGDVEEIATTGSGNVVRATSPTLVTPALGTPSALVLTNATSLPTAALPAGSVVQMVSTTSTTGATGTGTIPFDDTIPQSGEGTEFLTLAITPIATANKLVIQFVGFFSNSIATHIIAALFQDSTANALAVGENYQTTATGGIMIPITHTMAAGTTSSTTFRIRAGGDSASTTTFNGEAGARKFGAITHSSIVIWEVKV